MTQGETLALGGVREYPPAQSAAHVRRDAAENRERILEVARRLFAECGVEAVTMHRIAQGAGVGQATIYRHYLNKGELCRDLISESAANSAIEMESYLSDSANLPALDRLDGVLLRVLTFMEEKLPYLAAMGDACAGENRTSKFNIAGYRWLHGIIAGLLRDAREEGSIRSSDIDFTAAAVLAAVGPDMYQFQHEDRGLTPEQIVQAVRSLYS